MHVNVILRYRGTIAQLVLVIPRRLLRHPHPWNRTSRTAPMRLKRFTLPVETIPVAAYSTVSQT